MSLIQEALKRQQEEENKGKNSAGADQSSPAQEPTEELGAPEILPGISAAPPPPLVAPSETPSEQIPAVPPSADELPEPQAPTPPPAPEKLTLQSAATPPPVPAEEPATPEGSMSSRVPSVFLQSEKKKKSALPIIAGIIILVVIIAGGGFFFMKNQSGSESTAAASTSELLDIDPISDDQQPAQDTPEPTAGSQAVTPAGTATSSGQPTASISKPVVPEPKARVVWPSLTLSGVMGKGKKGSAIINGEFLGVGDTIEGVIIISVQEKSVNLSYMGEKQSLKVGNTTM